MKDLLRALLLVAVLVTLAAASNARADDEELAEKIDVLSDEIARLKEQLAVPETDEELKGVYGMGPAASRVYGVRQGVSIGGYGEFYFASPLEEKDESGAMSYADFYRFISYFGYKFNDQIVMNTEIEFEHATTGDGTGEASVEFSYLDFLLSDAFNIRAGNLLVPSGITNVMHEPAYYHGNFRPDTETAIIPSTWRELGAGAHGSVAESFHYTAYVLNGLDGRDFGPSGVRGGRQKGGKVVWEDVGGIVAMEYDQRGVLQVGGSVYVGGADQGFVTDSGGEAIDVTNAIYEGHARYRWKGLELRGLVAASTIDGASELTEALFADPDDAALVIPDQQLGYYVQAAYDVGPLLFGKDSTTQFSPWIRFEQVDRHSDVPELAGRPKDESLNTTSVIFGLDVKPHPNVVIKVDYAHLSDAADSPLSDELRVGAGFVY
jgi:hypothetical protein